MPPPTALVTCGPAVEPIDAVRRITNFSTGELGSILSDTLAACGFSVLCLRSEAATFPPPQQAPVEAFSTNQSLDDKCARLAPPPDVIFHAAALCDYTVAKIEGATHAAKIRSDEPELRLTLHPAPKLLPRLREYFPHALIVGWKYELDGTRGDALARGRTQLAKARNDLCVVNGAAYGKGFGILSADTLTHADTKEELCQVLCQWALAHLKSR